MTTPFLTISLLILSVVAGGLLVDLLEKKKQSLLIKLTLALSGGFLLSIAFTHFLPELYHHHINHIGVWVLVGFLIQLFLEYFSGGIEHGHIHTHSKVPFSLLFSLSVHSFIEGIPLASTSVSHAGHSHHGMFENSSLLLGIILHQFPVAIALMTVFKQSALSKSTSWVLLLLFSTMIPLGYVVGHFVPNSVDSNTMQILLAVVVGMFLHISTTIIFETNENHRFNFLKLASILAGVGLSLLIS